MASTGAGSLSSLIKRLEAATSRLEDLAVQPWQAGASGATGAAAAAGAQAGANGQSSAAAEVPTSVEAWDDDVAPRLTAFNDLSSKIGGNVQAQAGHVVAAFAGVRSLLMCAGNCKKPTGSPSAPSPIFMKLLEPIQKALGDASQLRESNRGDKQHFNHLSAISEGLPAVGWVAVEPKPGPYVEEMKNAGQFYFNRVIKEFKDTDKTHVEWCRAFTALLDEMKAYVMKHHTTGLVWNAKGGDASTFSGTAAATDAPPAPPAAPPAPAAPAPPGPPPPPAPAAAVPAAAGGMDAVFGQINKGEGITGGLRKVDKSEMTHKNPDLRSTAAPVAAGSKPAPPRPGTKPGAAAAKKPAKTALEGNKWSIEYHENESGIVIDETSLGQTVNVFGCKNTVIQVKGKINAIQMVSCQKTSILLETLVSSLELTSSPGFTVQVTGSVPTILVDSCDSGQIYLGPAALQAEIVTAKSSAINVSVPAVGGEEGEFVELALPEQLRHQVQASGKTIKSEVIEHSG